MISLTAKQPLVSKGFRVDVSRGERVGRVSSEWFSRPDDERCLSLTDLRDAVRRRAEHAQTLTVKTRAVRVEASRDGGELLALLVPGRDKPIAPTRWSFGLPLAADRRSFCHPACQGSTARAVATSLNERGYLPAACPC
jgi:hypothetical protein